MAFIPVPDVAHVRLEGVVDGQQTINDLDFRLSGGIVLATLQSLVTNLGDWFTLSFAPVVSEAWSTVAIHARDVSAEFSFVVDVAPTPTAGGVSGEPAPNNVAACISFRTGTAGRSFRGRNYIPAIPNSLVDVNTLDPAFMSSAQNAYALLGPGGGALPAGWEWVVVSKFSGVDTDGKAIPRATGISTAVTNILFTNSIVDSQRRRLPGRGK